MRKVSPRLIADPIDAGVGTPSLSELHDALVNILFHEIQSLGAAASSKLEPLRHRIDGDDPLGPQQEGALDRKLSNGTAAPDRDCLASFEVAEFRAHVTGRKNVGEEQHLLVTKAFRHLERADVRVGHPQKFRLPSRIAPEQVRIAEQTGGRVAPELRCLFVIGIRAFAAREIASLAKETLAAGYREWHDHAVSDLQLLVFGADFDDLAHGLMAEDIAALHLGNDAVKDMKVGTADGASRHLNDGIARMLDFGIRHCLTAQIILAVPCQCLHEILRPVAKTRLRATAGRNG